MNLSILYIFIPNKNIAKIKLAIAYGIKINANLHPKNFKINIITIKISKSKIEAVNILFFKYFPP